MNFQYKAKNNKGRIITGLVQSPNRNEAISLIEDKGYTLLNIEAQEEKKGLSLDFLQKIQLKDMVTFYRSLAMMISSDVAIVEALKVIGGQTANVQLQKIVQDVHGNVNEGMRLSDALSLHSRVFGDFYIHMIRSGEASGKLDEVLEYLADQQVKDYEFRAKIKGAMTYPVFVLSAMFVMGMGMFIFVIPRLTAMLIESGVALPLITRIMIGISDFCKNYWYLIIIVVVGGGLGFRHFISNTLTGKKFWARFTMMIPQFGPNLVKKTYLVRLTRSLAMLITGGVPLVEAIEISSSVVGNYYYQELLLETAESVKDGNSIASVFSHYPNLIPSMLSHMTAIGEQSGRVDQVFGKIGDFYAKEVDNTVENLSKLLEPIVMIILGIGVGVLVISIMVPMFKASQAV